MYFLFVFFVVILQQNKSTQSNARPNFSGQDSKFQTSDSN